MPVLQINREMVTKVLKNLKSDKSSGLDNMHPEFLKKTASAIAYPLTIIFDQALITGTIPNEWKHAPVCVIYKKGDKFSAGNYRPVSLTSVICKVMESIVREYINKFMRSNNFFLQNIMVSYRGGLHHCSC